MKTRIIIYLTATILLHLTVQQALGQKALAQKPLRDLFPEKKVIAEAQISTMTLNRRSFNATKRYVSVFGYLDNKTLLSKVYLYDTNGKLLWEKQLPYVKNIVIADESDKVIVIYDDRIREIDREKWRNACFDRAGNKLWDIVVPGGGITMSPDGKYGIVAIGGGGDRHFRVYDLETGQELETPFVHTYNKFRAQFIDSERVVVLIQNIDVARDTVALKRVLRMKREGGFNPRKGVPNTWIKTYHPAIFIIYDIPSQTILTEREMLSPNGESLYVPIGGAKYMSVSADKKHIALALYKFLIPPDKKRNLTLVQVDLEGNVEWENVDLPRSQIDGLFNLNNGTILVSEPPHIYDLVARFHLVDSTDGKTLWRYIVNRQGRHKRGGVVIRHLFIKNDRLVIQTTNDVLQSTIHIIDIETGSSLQDTEYSSQEILLLNNASVTIIHNMSENQVQFFK